MIDGSEAFEIAIIIGIASVVVWTANKYGYFDEIFKVKSSNASGYKTYTANKQMPIITTFNDSAERWVFENGIESQPDINGNWIKKTYWRNSSNNIKMHTLTKEQLDTNWDDDGLWNGEYIPIIIRTSEMAKDANNLKYDALLKTHEQDVIRIKSLEEQLKEKSKPIDVQIEKILQQSGVVSRSRSLLGAYSGRIEEKDSDYNSDYEVD